MANGKQGQGFTWDDDNRAQKPAASGGFTWDSDKSAPPPEAQKSASETGMERTPGTWEKLTRPYNPDLEAFAEKHPVLGAPARFLDEVGGAFMAMPQATVNTVFHPLDTAADVIKSVNAYNPAARESNRLLGMPTVTPEAAWSVLPEALGQGVGSVASGEVIPKVLPSSESIARAARTPEGKLRMPLREGARGLGAYAGYKLGGTPAGIVGAISAPRILDAIIPDRPFEMTPKIYDEARNEMYEQKGEALMRRGREAGRIPEVGGTSDRLILTEPEAQAAEQLQKVAARRASERGMQYAAGMRPAGVRRVPTRIETVEYPPPREVTRFEEPTGEFRKPQRPFKIAAD